MNEKVVVACIAALVVEASSGTRVQSMTLGLHAVPFDTTRRGDL